MAFYLINTASKRRTKMARKAVPGHQKYVQRLCGGTVAIRRGRHFAITERQLLEYRKELEEKQDAGAIEVRSDSPVGPIVEFATLDGAEQEEITDAQTVSEEPDDEAASEASDEAAGDEEREAEDEEVADYSSLTKPALIELILSVAEDWSESELRKMKKAELVEIVS